MRISEWSSDVCSSDLLAADVGAHAVLQHRLGAGAVLGGLRQRLRQQGARDRLPVLGRHHRRAVADDQPLHAGQGAARGGKSEEHTSEIQSLMRSSYAVFCWKKKNKTQ